MFVSKIDIEHIKSINQFYEQIIYFEEARLGIKHTMHQNLKAKVNATQRNIANILLYNNYIDEYLVSRLEAFNLNINNAGYTFLPNIVLDYFLTSKRNHKKNFKYSCL